MFNKTNKSISNPPVIDPFTDIDFKSNIPIDKSTNKSSVVLPTNPFASPIVIKSTNSTDKKIDPMSKVQSNITNPFGNKDNEKVKVSFIKEKGINNQSFVNSDPFNPKTINPPSFLVNPVSVSADTLKPVNVKKSSNVKTNIEYNPFDDDDTQIVSPIKPATTLSFHVPNTVTSNPFEDQPTTTDIPNKVDQQFNNYVDNKSTPITQASSTFDNFHIEQPNEIAWEIPPAISYGSIPNTPPPALSTFDSEEVPKPPALPPRVTTEEYYNLGVTNDNQVVDDFDISALPPPPPPSIPPVFPDSFDSSINVQPNSGFDAFNQTEVVEDFDNFNLDNNTNISQPFSFNQSFVTPVSNNIDTYVEPTIEPLTIYPIIQSNNSDSHTDFKSNKNIAPISNGFDAFDDSDVVSDFDHLNVPTIIPSNIALPQPIAFDKFQATPVSNTFDAFQESNTLNQSVDLSNDSKGFDLVNVKPSNDNSISDQSITNNPPIDDFNIPIVPANNINTDDSDKYDFSMFVPHIPTQPIIQTTEPIKANIKIVSDVKKPVNNDIDLSDILSTLIPKKEKRPSTDSKSNIPLAALAKADLPVVIPVLTTKPIEESDPLDMSMFSSHIPILTTKQYNDGVTNNDSFIIKNDKVDPAFSNLKTVDFNHSSSYHSKFDEFEDTTDIDFNYNLPSTVSLPITQSDSFTTTSITPTAKITNDIDVFSVPTNQSTLSKAPIPQFDEFGGNKDPIFDFTKANITPTAKIANDINVFTVPTNQSTLSKPPVSQFDEFGGNDEPLFDFTKSSTNISKVENSNDLFGLSNSKSKALGKSSNDFDLFDSNTNTNNDFDSFTNISSTAPNKPITKVNNLQPAANNVPPVVSKPYHVPPVVNKQTFDPFESEGVDLFGNEFHTPRLSNENTQSHTINKTTSNDNEDVMTKFRKMYNLNDTASKTVDNSKSHDLFSEDDDDDMWGEGSHHLSKEEKIKRPIKHNSNEGIIYARLSTRALFVKDWVEYFWVIQEDTLFIYRSRADYSVTALGNKAKKKIPLLPNIKLLKIKPKEYKGYGILYNFMIEQVMDYGPLNLGKFASPDKNTVGEFWTAINNILKVKRKEEAQFRLTA